MTDSSSPIKDLYNADVPLDPNGKHLPWLWVLLLPFVEDQRIVDAFKQCEGVMSEDELRRNKFGNSLMFVHTSHPLANSVASRIPYDCSDSKENISCVTFGALEGQGISGSLKLPQSRWYSPLNQKIDSPFKKIRYNEIARNLIFCFEYDLPSYTKHESKVLEGAIPPPRMLSIEDVGIRKFPKLNKGR